MSEEHWGQVLRDAAMMYRLGSNPDTCKVDAALDRLKVCVKEEYDPDNFFGYADSLLGTKLSGELFNREQLVVIAGDAATPCRPLLLKLINDNLEKSNPVFWLTAGNGIVASLKALIHDWNQLDFSILQNPTMSDEQEKKFQEALDYYQSRKLVISSGFDMSPDFLIKRIKQEMEGYDFPLLVVDDLLPFFYGWGHVNATNGVSGVLQFLKALAVEMGCAVIAGINMQEATVVGGVRIPFDSLYGFSGIIEHADGFCTATLVRSELRRLQKFPMIEFVVHKNHYGSRCVSHLKWCESEKLVRVINNKRID